MKYSLRALLIATTLAPPLLAGGFTIVSRAVENARRPKTNQQSFSLCQPLLTPRRIIIQPEDEAKLGLNVDEH